jgi:hypothetical protein
MGTSSQRVADQAAHHRGAQRINARGALLNGKITLPRKPLSLYHSRFVFDDLAFEMRTSA